MSHLPHRFSLRQTSIRQIFRKNGTLSQLLAPSMLISENTNGLLTKHAKTKVLLFKTNLYIFKSTIRKTHCHVLVQIKYLPNMFSFIHRQMQSYLSIITSCSPSLYCQLLVCLRKSQVSVERNSVCNILKIWQSMAPIPLTS